MGTTEVHMMQSIPDTPPNPPMQSTPLRVDKIVAILTFRCGQTSFQSIRAARLMGIPFGVRGAWPAIPF
jgi:hypothetical protein